MENLINLLLQHVLFPLNLTLIIFQITGMDLLGGCGGCTPPYPWPGGVQGGCYFYDKAEKYERHNEIHVIVMICHTVSEYHV